MSSVAVWEAHRLWVQRFRVQNCNVFNTNSHKVAYRVSSSSGLEPLLAVSNFMKKWNGLTHLYPIFQKFFFCVGPFSLFCHSTQQRVDILLYEQI